MGSAGRPAQARGGGLRKVGGSLFQPQVFIQQPALQGLVGLALAGQGTFACRHHPCAHHGAGLARLGLQKFGGRQGGHFHMQINAVEQRATQARLVARHLGGGAAAGVLAAARKAAGAGVHGGNQLKARRKFGPLRGTRNGDVAAFQRLAQCFQGAAGKFGKFVQKQHAFVRQ